MTYMFSGRQEALERLELLNALFFPATRDFVKDNLPGRVGLLLDLGCGPGYTTRSLSSVVDAGRIIGLDSSEFFIERARELSEGVPQIEYRLHDMTQMPFPTAGADAIYLRFLLTHLRDPRTSLLEWASHLVDGGLMLIEETEEFNTEVPVFREYMEMSEALLESNDNVLFIGGLLDGWDYEGKLSRGYSGVARVRVPTGPAARMFYLNTFSWEDSPFIKKNYGGDVGRIKAELNRMAESGDPTSTIEWGVRQVRLEKA